MSTVMTLPETDFPKAGSAAGLLSTALYGGTDAATGRIPRRAGGI